MFDISATGIRDPILVAATDGVGTKLKIASSMDDHSGIGIDLVAMCVNDLIIQGAEPLFFLDYLATSKLIPDRAEEVVSGITNGCKQAGCALIGGETAEMPDMYQGNDYDLAGFAVGAVGREQVLTGETIAEGDVVLGIKSSGIHSNGFSLVRKIVEDTGHNYESIMPFNDMPLGSTLLTPTRIYVKSCLALHKVGLLKGLAHITGGGLVENIPRILPDGLGVKLEGHRWPIDEIFKWLSKKGNITPREMARTFNCGIGMIAIVAPDDSNSAKKVLSQHYEIAYEIGSVQKLEQQAVVEIVNWEEAWRN